MAWYRNKQTKRQANEWKKERRKETQKEHVRKIEIHVTCIYRRSLPLAENKLSLCPYFGDKPQYLKKIYVSDNILYHLPTTGIKPGR